MLSSSVWRGKSHWWFSIGLLAGGFTSALVAVTVGSLLLRPFVPAILAIAAVILLFVLITANEFGIARLPLLQNGRQVPQSITDDGGQYGALQFGFEMGTGVRTFMTSGLPHALAACLILVATWPIAIIAGLGFGAGRAWMTLSRHAHHDHVAWNDSLTKFDRGIRGVLTVASALSLAVIIHAWLGI